MKTGQRIVIAGLVLFSLTMSCAAKKDYLVTIKTSLGEVKLILFDDTPLHKENFLALAEAGRYDGTFFHRVIKEFMVQGGDVNAKEGTTPNPESMVPAEILSHNFHKRGAVAAARNNNPEKKSSECQFYIVQGKQWTEQELTLDQPRMTQYLRQLLTKPEYAEQKQEIVELQQSQNIEGLQAKIAELKPVVEREFDTSLDKPIAADRLEAYTTMGGAPHLDDEYTVFGEVLSGMEVVDAIAELETDAMDKPVEEILMEVTVEKISRSKVTRIYGYQYPEKP